MKRSKFLLGLFTLCASGIIASNHAASFPSVIPLPAGWIPEGIAVGRGSSFFVGARGGIFEGAIYRGDLRTGQGGLLVAPQPGRRIIGIKVDKRSNYLFAAGGPTGRADVYDAASGALLATYQFASMPPATFINDAAITRDAVFFTDSNRPVLYKIALTAAGELANPGAFETIPLNGFQSVPGFNANGIAATPDGSTLIVVNMASGVLYRVDADTGDSAPIDLGGDTVASGDGLVLSGHTLYVVRNFPNYLAVVELDSTLESGVLVNQIQTPAFNLPATAAEFGNSIYLVNAFGPASPSNPYTVFKVSK